MIPEVWLSERTLRIELSGIRKVFELGKSLRDPINLSIGQPHFPVPEPIRDAAKAAIDAGHNGYTVTQGIPELREKIAADLAQRFHHQDRDVLITSGTSGGLLLALLAVVNPGDEVIIPDPYFVGYPHMVTLAGGRIVPIPTYPDFQIDPDQVQAAISPRTKAILLSTPANPTGVVIDAERQKALAEVAERNGVLLISDEIYRAFHYDAPASSPAAFNEHVLVVEGFGKTYGITGWRLGYAHGPRRLIAEMMKLQQFTYVCAPSIAQHAALAACEYDVSPLIADYRRKRDRLVAGLQDRYEFVCPGGAFYLFPKCPGSSAAAFAAEAIRHNLLIIPGHVFSVRDSHFRISYAVNDETLEKGIAVLNKLAG